MIKFILALAASILISGCSKPDKTVQQIIDGSKELTMLSAVQKEYIASHEVIMGYPKNIEPIVFDVNGMPDGIAAKYAKLISKRTGLRFKYMLFDSNSALVGGFRNKSFDVAMAASDIEERRSLVTVTRPYMTSNSYMLVDELPIKFPMKVGVGSSYSITQSIKKLGGSVQFVMFTNDEEAFKSLMRKELGGVVVGQSVGDFLEKKYSRPYAHSNMNFVFAIGFGCQVSQVQLCEILNMGVDSITPQERRIFEKESLAKPLKLIDKPVKYGLP